MISARTIATILFVTAVVAVVTIGPDGYFPLHERPSTSNLDTDAKGPGGIGTSTDTEIALTRICPSDRPIRARVGPATVECTLMSCLALRCDAGRPGDPEECRYVQGDKCNRCTLPTTVCLTVDEYREALEK